MPEIGAPQPNNSAYSQVSIGPRSSNAKSQNKANENIINKAAGQKPKSIYKDGPHNQLGKDEFLKLLSFQLQNQDPMNPMDQHKMTGELAQFSQLEQLSNLNSKYDKANQNQMIQDKFFAASFVGKEIVTSGSTIKLLDEGVDADVLFKLDGDADKMVIRIMDEKNQTVGEIWTENVPRGAQQITWDGVSLDGQPAAKGSYKAVIKAWDKNCQEVMARTQATGLVESVSFEDGEPVLLVSGQKVYLRDVSNFRMPKGSADSSLEQNLPAAQSSISHLELNKNKLNPQAVNNAYVDQMKGIYD